MSSACLSRHPWDVYVNFMNVRLLAICPIFCTPHSRISFIGLRSVFASPAGFALPAAQVDFHKVIQKRTPSSPHSSLHGQRVSVSGEMTVANTHQDVCTVVFDHSLALAPCIVRRNSGKYISSEDRCTFDEVPMHSQSKWEDIPERGKVSCAFHNARIACHDMSRLSGFRLSVV